MHSEIEQKQDARLQMQIYVYGEEKKNYVYIKIRMSSMP
jgi:hypothetical protein